MSVPPDPYSVLGVPREASQAAVRSAFRALVRRYHPDTRDPAQTSDAELMAVLVAYRMLRNPASRTAYDQSHPAQSFPPEVPRPAARSAAQQDDRRPARARGWAMPRASDLYLADPFYASSFFADPNPGDPYFVRIIR